MTCDEVKLFNQRPQDGEVNAVECVAIDSHPEAEACRSCNEEMDAQELLRAAIRDEMPYYRAPAHLREHLTSTLRGPSILTGAIAGRPGKFWALPQLWSWWRWQRRRFSSTSTISVKLWRMNFSRAHVRALLSHTMDVVSSDHHTVKPWFNAKVPFSPPVVDLASEGFPLEGGRLDSVGARVIAVFVYSRLLHRIDVFVWPVNGQTPPHFERDGYNELSWSKNDFLFPAVCSGSA